ncbi:uncharacterized protein CANTADRAFT_138744 [Suhomyces tanzawaensis NRRL Y-17324]|uniref:Uncharacterized protein n=1 Tax=Suhomyces tanzawaensis NRRL Y-17324 TaxID=984487 RepID=A0A1E4SRV8_9ASCO|nr:uncharacterized protein CANTADRAFT_138744 [Suhomyces tanzawaensis NRRL Y-17324]ODV82241.1 hypothetical protein CANTADRAFT_138744 [Suhomyces tanzawaensis NRRL Y-17324]
MSSLSKGDDIESVYFVIYQLISDTTILLLEVCADYVAVELVILLYIRNHFKSGFQLIRQVSIFIIEAMLIMKMMLMVFLRDLRLNHVLQLSPNCCEKLRVAPCTAFATKYDGLLGKIELSISEITTPMWIIQTLQLSPMLEETTRIEHIVDSNDKSATGLPSGSKVEKGGSDSLHQRIVSDGNTHEPFLQSLYWGNRKEKSVHEGSSLHSIDPNEAKGSKRSKLKRMIGK